MRRDAPVELLESDAAREITGTDRYVCAMLDRRGGQVNPLGYARGLAQAAMQAGAAVHGATPALEVKRNGTWNVRTPTGTVRADKLVLATNGYTDDVWPGLRRSVVPVFSAIVASEPLPRAPMQSVLYEMGRVTVYYRFDRANRLLMGGRSLQRDVSEPRELQYLIGYAERLWPEVRGGALDACMERTVGDHAGPLSARARAGRVGAGLSRLQRSRRGDEHGDGAATGATRDRR